MVQKETIIGIRVSDALLEEILARKLGDEKLAQTARRILKAGLTVTPRIKE